MRPLARFLALPALIIVSVAPAAAGEKINYKKYFQSAQVISAIAAAVAFVDDCSKPLEISETRKGNTLTLGFTCPGGENEEATSYIRFNMTDDGLLIPEAFDFAG